MKIVELTPGAGGMYCGSCLRDHALVSTLQRMGHDAILAPMYLPMQLDDPSSGYEAPLFFGAVNVYLQQKSRLFRQAPEWMDRALDAPGLLRWAAGFVGKTNPEELGELTLSVLQGEHGKQAKELEKLVRRLKGEVKPDIVCLSNALLLGLARRIRADLNVPVICTLQGEDTFIDGLPEPYRSQAWTVLEERARDVELFIAVSHYHADIMQRRLKLPPGQIRIVHNGIALDGFVPAAENTGPPVLGYFARLCRLKGAQTLVDAFVLLKQRNQIPGLKLKLGGSMTPADEAFVEGLRADLAQRGLGGEVQFFPNLDRKQKLAFLQSLSVFSVPATYGESFGLYVLEALASGVPVVQPRHGAFPEILEMSGGGVLCDPDNPAALADAIEKLLEDRQAARAVGLAGREKVLQYFNVDRMAREVSELCESAKSQPKISPA